MNPLQVWAGADDETARLHGLTPGEVEGTVEHPLQCGDRDAYLASVKGKRVVERVEQAPTKVMSLAKLRGIQGSVNVERVLQYVREPSVEKGKRAPGSGKLVDLPIVVRVNGELYLHDGHHRATAAWLKGAREMRVRYVDLDKEEK